MPLWLQVLIANSLTILLLALVFVASLYWQPIKAKAGKVAGVFSPLAKYRQLLIGVLIGAVGAWAGQALGGGIDLSWLRLPVWSNPLAPSKPDRVTYVYEKDQGEVPSSVRVALSTLNRKDILATVFEEDTTDGTGDTPEQYKVAKAEAQKAGLPAIVSQAGDKVLRVVKSPTTEEQVLELAP